MQELRIMDCIIKITLIGGYDDIIIIRVIGDLSNDNLIDNIKIHCKKRYPYYIIQDMVLEDANSELNGKSILP